MIQSFSRCMDILKMISEQPDGAKVSDLTRDLKLKYTTVYNLVLSMEQERVIRRDPENNKLYLGAQLSEFHHSRMNGRFLVHARVVMESLIESYPECNLTYSQFRGSSITALLNRSCDFGGAIRTTGNVLPIYQTVAGVVFLTFLPEEDSLSLRNNYPLNEQVRNLWDGEAGLENAVRACRKNRYARLPFDPVSLTRIGIPMFFKGQLSGALTCSCLNMTASEREQLIRRLRVDMDVKLKEPVKNLLSFHA